MPAYLCSLLIAVPPLICRWETREPGSFGGGSSIMRLAGPHRLVSSPTGDQLGPLPPCRQTDLLPCPVHQDQRGTRLPWCSLPHACVDVIRGAYVHANKQQQAPGCQGAAFGLTGLLLVQACVTSACKPAACLRFVSSTLCTREGRRPVREARGVFALRWHHN